MITLPKALVDKFNKELQEPRLSANLELVDLLRRIGKQHNTSPGEVTIAWTLRHPAVTAAIVGGRTAVQVEDTVRAASLALSEQKISEIEAFLASMPA